MELWDDLIPEDDPDGVDEVLSLAFEVVVELFLVLDLVCRGSVGWGSFEDLGALGRLGPSGGFGLSSIFASRLAILILFADVDDQEYAVADHHVLLLFLQKSL